MEGRGEGQGTRLLKKTERQKKEKKSMLLNKVLFNGVFVIKCFKTADETGEEPSPIGAVRISGLFGRPLR